MVGTFITFEGCDGSGKTTQVQRLAGLMRSEGYEVVTTREPGGTPGADAVRHVVLSGAAQSLGPNIEAVLFAAARADHLSQVIRPALEREAIVICDRFHDSTRVYQMGADETDQAFLARLEAATLDGVFPDLTIILDVPAELGVERARARRSASAADRFEGEEAEVHRKRRDRFLSIAENEPERCVVIDGRGDEEEIMEDIVAVIEDRLGIVLTTGGTGTATDAGSA
ncbi:dTMP kinase [Fulvimarina endophytica]|uniref:Thymidylate kinase n=1 Tax=Fulvimarina endophytica TaxID=2293836 RepID=A0A371XAI8_9HYPH|nr:dTMP kinase [Fulvimarina endophytica]RFC66236.1 dTMP kinase [Fulvimarina endophytica]